MGCGGRFFSPDVSGLSRVPGPSVRRQRESRRLPAKSHLSLAPNRGWVNGSFESAARTEMPRLSSQSESASSVGPCADNRSDRDAIDVWPNATQNAGVKARYRHGDSRCRSPAGYVAQIMPQPTSGPTFRKQLTCHHFRPRLPAVSTVHSSAGVAIVTNYNGVPTAAELHSSATEFP